jgi:hypothetical protein
MNPFNDVVVLGKASEETKGNGLFYKTDPSAPFGLTRSLMP